MMPQKLNPDVAELARAKAGTALGRLAGLLAVVKGLPLAYNRDLQEDKAPLFAARRDVATTTAAVDVLVRELTFDGDRLALAAADPLLFATDAAERLVDDGMPFAMPTSASRGAVLNGPVQPPEECAAAGTTPGPSSIHEAISAARARLKAV